MKRFFNAITIATGLAIFSMFFGAGNLMFPPKVGLIAGDQNLWAILGFLITGVCLPVLGLISILLFDGNYHTFFRRLGNIPGTIMMIFCLLIIGPLIAIPRIVTLSYTMVSPFLPALDYNSLPLISSLANPKLFIFSIIFLFITFLTTIKEGKIVDILGYVVSPLLLLSLSIIIVKGLMMGGIPTPSDFSSAQLFWQNLKYGYGTLDIIGAIFFSSIVIHILKAKMPNANVHELAMIGLKAGTIGVSILGIVYFGLSYLGVFHGHGFEHLHEGLLFSAISFRILGEHGALIIATAVLMACLSTIIALSAIFAEFLQLDVFNNRISYATGLIITLVTALIPANLGLENILQFSKPFLAIGYPAIIILTICNILYKTVNFKLVKIPVLLTLLASIISFFTL
ncbi:MAG: branched-chain amino acid transport system II carrier protein [Candidatus Babeliales bacterium]